MRFDDLETKQFFKLKEEDWCRSFFSTSLYPWELLPGISAFILALGPQLSLDLYEKRGEDIWLARSARIADYATILGPAIIGEGVEIRPGAYIRGNVLVGTGSVVGNSTEIKNAILLGQVEAPHFNYIGDSILSYGAHLGAGVITSNLRSDRKNVRVICGEGQLDTGLRKFGAMVSQGVEIGCNAVLNPGVMLGAGSLVYPLSCVRQCLPPGFIFKNRGEMTPIQSL